MTWPGRLALWAAVAVYATVVVRTAWLCDDAYITLRVVENAAHGGGLRWNVADRVLVSTHPLWLLLLAGVRPWTGEVYGTTLALSGLLDLLALVLLVRIARSTAAAFAGIAVLTMSRAFVDYSTSGLENPLSHALVALLVAASLARPGPRRLLAVSLLAGLLLMTRYDHALLALPVAAAVFWEQRGGRALALAAVGMLPFAAWLVFAFVYFGTIWPMPAQAKLFATGLPLGEVLRQGSRYFAATGRNDTVTMAALALGLAAALLGARPLAALGTGIALYLGYVLRIGGDFMLGRFFATPLLAAVLCLVHGRWLASWRRAVPVAAAAVLLGMLRPYPTLCSGPGYTGQGFVDGGITDERGIYYAALGLLSPSRSTPQWGAGAAVLPPDPTGPQVVVEAAVGCAGFVLGPHVHVVDPLLCDPLVGRLPAVTAGTWRPGHLHRPIPAGYLETLARGANHVRHAGLARYLDALHTLTRGELFAPGRLATAWAFARGAFDPLLRDYIATDHEAVRPWRVAAADLRPVPEGTRWHDPAVLCLYEGGAVIDLGAPSKAARITIALHSQGYYRIELLRAGAAVGQTALRTRDEFRFGMGEYAVDVPPAARQHGFDALHVRHDLPASIDRIGAVGHVRLHD